jgi:DNA-binding SARP family transcriptional activator
VLVSDLSAALLELRLLGPFRIQQGGSPLPPLRSRKGYWLLALLTLRAGRPVERSWLAATLWPDTLERKAQASLRKSLTDLRRALGPEADRIYSPSAHTLALRLAGAEVDVLAFDSAIERGDMTSLQQAIFLYRGPLLEGCSEEWAFAERQVREQVYLNALDRLAAHRMALGDPSAAEHCLRLAVAVDPVRESTCRGLMQALAAGGNPTAADQVYRQLKRRLQREFQTGPDPATTGLHQQIRSELRRRSPQPEPRRIPRGQPGNLPRPLDSFVGRAAEINAALQLLHRADVHLLTCLGPGGIGKTRLALEIAGRLDGAFPHGCFIVELAPTHDPILIASVVAQVLRVKQTPAQPALEQLKAYLREKQVLLVLDNFEHLLPAAPLVTDLLASCSALKVIVTSREALRLRGEHELSVPPLGLAAPQDLSSFAAVAQIEAVQLLVQRALAVKPDFALTHENADPIVQICLRLEGIPCLL